MSDELQDLPMIAEVVCRAEGSAEEKPFALRCGGEQEEILRISADEVIGPALAGDKNQRRVVAALTSGQIVVLTRAIPDGGWRVFLRKSGRPTR
ncbi:MAG: hypothetical protein GY906_01035 [bacterium]|nr:hypothetical protein [bacterium]